MWLVLTNVLTGKSAMNAERAQRYARWVGILYIIALGVAEGDDDTGIWVTCEEVTNGNWGVGEKIPSLFQLPDMFGGDVSEDRRKVMEALYPK